MTTAQRRLPQRNPAVLSREVDGEFVVVDEAANAAHQLTGPVAEVWRAIEGGSAPALLEEQVDQIVAELLQRGLVVEPRGMTRRTMLQRTGVVVAATGLSTIALPAAVAHASTNVGTTLTLATTTTTPAQGGNFTLTATLKRSQGSQEAVAGALVTLTRTTVGVPGSSVVVGTAVTGANGVATFNLATPTTGVYDYVAGFAGDSTYNAASSSPVRIFSTAIAADPYDGAEE